MNQLSYKDMAVTKVVKIVTGAGDHNNILRNVLRINDEKGK